MQTLYQSAAQNATILILFIATVVFRLACRNKIARDTQSFSHQINIKNYPCSTGDFLLDDTRLNSFASNFY